MTRKAAHDAIIVRSWTRKGQSLSDEELSGFQVSGGLPHSGRRSTPEQLDHEEFLDLSVEMGATSVAPDTDMLHEHLKPHADRKRFKEKEKEID